MLPYLSVRVPECTATMKVSIQRARYNYFNSCWHTEDGKVISKTSISMSLNLIDIFWRRIWLYSRMYVCVDCIILRRQSDTSILTMSKAKIPLYTAMILHHFMCCHKQMTRQLPLQGWNENSQFFFLYTSFVEPLNVVRIII